MNGMDTAPRAARPAPAPTPVPVAPPRIALGIGHIYEDNATGRHWTLSGLRAGRTVILIHDERGPGQEIRDRVDLDTLADGYAHVGCDHENYCCQSHRHHVALHRGCMMR